MRIVHDVSAVAGVLLALVFAACSAGGDTPGDVSPAADASAVTEPGADGGLALGTDARAPSDASTTDASTTDAGMTAACSGTTGDFHSQSLLSGGETRYYFLHVPADYTCGAKWPLLVDFHGTGFGALGDPVEESWAFPEMLAASDAEHFIVVRPRSRPTPSGSAYVYQWDLNDGDLPKNHQYARDLVADLTSRYDIDPSRVYAMGFSNGPTMAVQFLADSPSIMHGYAAISGGMNEAIAKGPALTGPSAPRVYEMTGYRDYMQVTQRTLDAYLAAASLDPSRVFRREADTGHELYGWHYHEAFRWMDQGTRPAPGTLSSAWSRDAAFTGTESLIQLATSPKNELYAVGTGGAVYRRVAGAWTKLASLTGDGVSLPLADICFEPSGEAFVAGDGWLGESADGAAFSVGARLPEMGGKGFGYTHVVTVGCGGGGLVAAGVWEGLTRKTDKGAWSELALGDEPPFFSQLRRLPSGTWLGTGYYGVLARSTDGATFAEIAAPNPDTQWTNALAVGASGSVWAVGEKGAIFVSHDDAKTFTTVASPGTEDLYAIGFSSDGARGVAVGSHGSAYVTVDSGATWTDRSTGLDGFLGDVTFTDAHTALVVGQGGAVLTTSL